MEKIFALMAFASMFALIACSADGVMEQSADAGSEQSSVASRVVAEAAAQRAANTPKSNKAEGCSISATANQVKMEMNYMGFYQTISIKDNDSFATITSESNDKEELSEFCEEFADEYDVISNAECEVSSGKISFDVQYGNGFLFERASEELKVYCNALNEALAEEEAEKSKEAEEENNSTTPQSTDNNDGWDDDYDDYEGWGDEDW